MILEVQPLAELKTEEVMNAVLRNAHITFRDYCAFPFIVIGPCKGGPGIQDSNFKQTRDSGFKTCDAL